MHDLFSTQPTLRKQALNLRNGLLDPGPVGSRQRSWAPSSWNRVSVGKQGPRWRLGPAAGMLLGIVLLRLPAVADPSIVGYSVAGTTAADLVYATRQESHRRRFPATAGRDSP